MGSDWLDAIEFIKESNAIESIFREPTLEEIEEHLRFIRLSKISIEDLEQFVSVYQPEARLRKEYNMDIRAGNYYPPFGGPEIVSSLQKLLDSDLNAFDLHVIYEHIHPFTDCNGRSGRALWAWKMKGERQFLQLFYYQTLEAASIKLFTDMSREKHE